jgi:magnesium-transporting ATPase (P-type)
VLVAPAHLSSAPIGRFAPNVVRNQKYNPASFLPLVLYEQFKFFFNAYFLAVALSQFVPALKIGSSPGRSGRRSRCYILN